MSKPIESRGLCSVLTSASYEVLFLDTCSALWHVCFFVCETGTTLAQLLWCVRLTGVVQGSIKCPRVCVLCCFYACHSLSQLNLWTRPSTQVSYSKGAKKAEVKAAAKETVVVCLSEQRDVSTCDNLNYTNHLYLYNVAV